ncbi:unnamed protein product [Heligmosomoides polygyrus]|uniref:Rab-GAP TBC domain-containing protein n=1 Tax=Heligmosomoides polygyrus TaxID=6339 RepID=A0A3P7Z4K4_HELPZ|nr:unnamed protein product [Heligmosomoides polygyrus]
MEVELAARWRDLTSFLCDATREKWWKTIIEAYRPRPFRGVPHLCAMFTLFDKYKDHLKDRYATAFAIFFKRQATHFVELILSVDVTFRVQHGEPLAGFFCSCVQLILTAVYDPIASDNAERSAQLLHQFAQDTTLDSENYVADLVVASGSYSTDAHLTQGVSGDEDVHYLIDFDMAFLGDNEEQFAEHEKAQRKEYSHLSDDEYRIQREKVSERTYS